MLISVEGGDGAGKTTLVRGLADHLRARGVALRTTLEPGGTALGQHLREFVLCGDEPINAWTETFLFLADRAADVEHVIRPALERGELVLCDRFADSTLAYQGYARGIDLDLLLRLNDQATGSLKADLTLLLDLPPAEGLARGQLELNDRIGAETLAFHERVRDGFRQIACDAPERVVVLDAAQPAAQVLDQALATAEPRLRAAGLLPTE